MQRAPREESVVMKGGISTASRDGFVVYGGDMDIGREVPSELQPMTRCPR